MAHFCIDRDGTIRQFLDVCELADQLPTLNGTSIGIEFVNDPWGNAGQADQMRQDGAVHNGVNATKVSAIRNLPSLTRRVRSCASTFRRRLSSRLW